jgi:hypothetical protein
METGIAVLMYVALAILLVPPLLTSFYLIGLPSLAKLPWNASPRTRFLPNSKIYGKLPRNPFHKLTELEKKLKTFQDAHKANDFAVINCDARIKRLEARLSFALQNVEKYKQLAGRSVRWTKNSFIRKSEEQRQIVSALNEQLKLKKLELEVLGQSRSQLQHGLITTYIKVQTEYAQSSVDKALSLNPILQTRSFIAKMEDKVQKREKDALKIPEWNESSEDVKGIEDAVERIANFGVAVGGLIENIKHAVNTADPSIDRAYNRFTKNLSLIQSLARNSSKQEEELEKKIESMSSANLSQRCENYRRQGEDALANTIAAMMESNVALAKELQISLSSHRRKNLQIERSLFRIEAIVRRLYMIKLLLTALPGTKIEELLAYTRIANTLTTYLQAEFGGKPISQPTKALPELLEEIETRTLMAYIRIAKGQSNRLSKRAEQRFVDDIATISRVIEIERNDAQTEFERWNNLTHQAVQEHRKLLHLVASERTTQSAHVLKTAQQSLEILSILTTRSAQEA